MANGSEKKKVTLVARKPCFGLPTACPHCLPVYLYLKFAGIPFDVRVTTNNPDSDQIPYVIIGSDVAYSNDSRGVIESLNADRIVDLDFIVQTLPEWRELKAMVEYCKQAVLYELWLVDEGSCAQTIYFSHLPGPVGKEVQYKQVFVRMLLGITKENAHQRAREIYAAANEAYTQLSTRVEDSLFLYGESLSSLDAVFIGQALFTIHALPEKSVLKSMLLQFENLVKYTEKYSKELVVIDSSSSSASSPKGVNPKNSKPKRKKKWAKLTKKFNGRGQYFAATLVVAALVFFTLLGSDEAETVLEKGD